MKKNFYHCILALTATLLITSCEKHDHDTEPDDPNKEHSHLRILISDEVSPSLALVTPATGVVSNHAAKFAKSALYSTESGRFAGIIHRENNLTETFDSGLEFHGDHVDTKGTPKFGAMIGESSQPTHFKSKKGEILTFNDGDGTLSVGNESDIHSVGMKMKTINAGLLKHHGAMATFSNGTYAVTEKDNSIPGPLPEKVKIIDKSGKTVHAAKLTTKGIHGNATDGTYAVFGSSSGILVIESNGQQKFIAHPEGFGTAWFGTILETSFPGKFIGYTAAKGAYMIDVKANTVKPIFESTDIMQNKVSYNKSKLGILLHSGDFKLFNLSNLALIKEGKVIEATEKTSTKKPQLELTEKFSYIILPTQGELLQTQLADLSKNTKLKVGNTPYRLALIGHENSANH
jgi:hypothetical protein